MEPQEEAIQRYMALGYNRDQATTHARSEIIRNQEAAQEEARVAKLKAEGRNADGSMIHPEYDSLIDPTTGGLKAPYQLRAGVIDPTTLEGYQALKTEAMRKGPSAWALLQKQMQDQARMAGMEKASAQTASGTAQARSGLAMRGGLSSGSRERIAAGGLKALLEARQGIGRADTSNRLNIDTTDEQNRLLNLNKFNDSELGLNKYNTDIKNNEQTYNLTNLLQDKKNQEAHRMAVYQEDNKKWAANKDAQATANSGGGGGSWICTKIHEAEPLGKNTQRALFTLRKHALKKYETVARCYLYDCEELAHRMDFAGVDWKDVRWLTDTVTTLVEAKMLDEAFAYYVGSMVGFIKKFWPDVENKVVREVLSA